MLKEFSDYLNEGKQERVDEALSVNVDKISKLTDRNNHLEAIAVLAKDLKLKKWVKVIDNLMAIDKELRGLPPELIKFENSIRDNLLKYAKMNMDSDQYKAIYGAF